MTTGSPVRLDLKKILAAAQLPALPQSAIRLLELSQDPSIGPADFAKPIESDPGLMGQVLKFVNSSYFGFSREISSVKLAISLVGIRTIKNFALWSAVFSLMPNPKCGPFDLKNLWEDSLRRAIFAREMAHLLGVKEPEEAFSAALLQDMAVPLLAKELPDLYAKLLHSRKDGKFRLSQIEAAVFGNNHAEVGGMMARQWNLPEAFAVMIESHLAIDELVSAASPQPTKLGVALSALLPTVADPMWLDAASFETYYRQAAPSGSRSIPEMLALVDEQFEQFAPVLRLSTPAKSLVDSFNEMAANPS